MTGTPINLSRARKTRARDAAKAQANENVVLFGRTRAQKDVEKTDATRNARRLEDHKRSDPSGE